MMNNHEKWEYNRNIDEIIEKLSDILLSMILAGVKKLSRDQKLILKDLGLDHDSCEKF